MISRRTSGALRLVLILVFGCAFAPAQDDQPGRTHAGSATIAAWSHAVPDLFPPSAAQFVDSSPNSLRQPGTVWHRMADFYLADWKATAPAAAEPVIRRGLEAPLSSPPFPFSDWSYGGASTIGAADGNVYPTMSALQQEGHRTHLYGWVEASGNASSSSGTNYPVTYGFVPNRPALNQAMLILERLPDTTQASRFDWGFHVSGFFGTDYRYTTSKGYVSNQLLKDNHQYGFDPLWESVDFYLPIKEGLVIRIGRFPSMPGIETQLAPSNFTITHSLAFSAAPSTETGAVATLKLTSQWMAQLGISAGHDVAPWTVDRKPSAIACVNYSTQSNHDNLYACANGINDGRYAYNNVQQFDLTWNHRFNAKWHMASEAWYMYERAVPNVEGNVQNPLPPETGANGAHCIAGQLACTAPAYAWVNYLNCAINPHLYVGFRSDMLDDRKGQRTGIPGKYTENTLYATKNFGTTVMLRPELRFDHSWDRKGYNNGTARNQVFFGADLIYKF